MEEMRQDVAAFIKYLKEKKQISENTAVSYERDLKKLSHFLETQGLDSVCQITATSLNSYLLFLEKEGKKPAIVHTILKYVCVYVPIDYMLFLKC